MIAVAWLVAQALATGTPACNGPDIAVRNVRYATVRGKGPTPDRIVINADVINVGAVSQTPGVAQHVAGRMRQRPNRQPGFRVGEPRRAPGEVNISPFQRQRLTAAPARQREEASDA